MVRQIPCQLLTHCPTSTNDASYATGIKAGGPYVSYGNVVSTGQFIVNMCTMTLSYGASKTPFVTGAVLSQTNDAIVFFFFKLRCSFKGLETQADK